MSKFLDEHGVARQNDESNKSNFESKMHMVI